MQVKYAIIINGDTEQPHLDNVEQSLAVLEGEGFVTFVASPLKPGQNSDYYTLANKESVKKLISEVELRIGASDELVIYTTGHGDEAGEDGRLCLQDGCDYSKWASLLDHVRYGQRTVIMDQCYSGNWNEVFLDDPKTLFISSGSKMEKVRSQEFAPGFWAKDIPDLNGDGKISWQERYNYAVNGRDMGSVPQFIPSPGYVQEGAPPFEPSVLDVKDRDKLEIALKKLKFGQYAVVLFSAVRCAQCKSYKSVFDDIAKNANGQFLFLRTEDEEAGRYYDVASFPTVMIISANGQRKVVLDSNRPLKELIMLALLPEQLLPYRISVAEKIENLKNRAHAFCKIALALTGAEPKEKIVELFEKLIAVAEENEDLKERADVFRDTAIALAKAGLKEKAVELFEKLIAAAEKIEDLKNRADALSYIISALARAGFKERAVEVSEKAISAAEKVGDLKDRAYAFAYIAIALAGARLKEMAAEVFEKAISAAEKIENMKDRAHALGFIAFALAGEGLKERAVEVFEKAIYAAKKIEDLKERTDEFRYIAFALAKAGLDDRVKIPKLP